MILRVSYSSNDLWRRKKQDCEVMQQAADDFAINVAGLCSVRDGDESLPTILDAGVTDKTI